MGDSIATALTAMRTMTTTNSVTVLSIIGILVTLGLGIVLLRKVTKR